MLLSQPQFFDIFGFFGFIFIIVLALIALNRKPLPRWMIIILLIIGLSGLIVDGLVVYSYYFL